MNIATYFSKNHVLHRIKWRFLFSLFILCVLSLSSYAQSTGIFRIDYLNPSWDNVTTYANTIEEALDWSKLDDPQLTVNVTFADGVKEYKPNNTETPFNIKIGKGVSFIVDFGDCEVEASVNFTIEHGGYLQIVGTKKLKKFVNSTFVVSPPNADDTDDQTFLSIAGLYINSPAGKSCLTIEPDNTKYSTKVVLSDCVFESDVAAITNKGPEDRSLLLRDRTYYFMYYAIEGENDEIERCLGEHFNSTTNVLEYASGNPVKKVIVREADSIFTISYEYKDGKYSEDFPSLADAGYIFDYIAYDGFKGATITLNADGYYDDDIYDFLNIDGNNGLSDGDILIDLTGHTLDGGTYSFYSSNDAKITIKGITTKNSENHYTDINARFVTEENGNMTISGGKYTNTSDSYYTIDNQGNFTINGGRFKSLSTAAIRNYANTLKIPEHFAYYEVTYDEDGNEIETQLEGRFNEDGSLVNASSDVVKDVIVQKTTITVDFKADVYYPQNPAEFCNGEETSVSLPFKVTKGKSTGYMVSFDNNAIPAVKGAVDDSGEGSIVIPIPEGLLSGEYKGTVTFNVDEEYYYPATYPITITADITPAVAVQLYTDMLIADNHDGRFTAYQWYKDGSPIADATQGYYYEEKLGGKYTVELTTTDGGKFMSCPVKLISTKALAQSVKAYPNPARKGETFAVEIADYDPAQEYSIMIFSANGLLVKKLTNVEQTTEMSLPTGVYSGSLISGGSKYGFKLIVE